MRRSKKSVASVLGWVGVVLILVAYAGNSLSIFSAQSSLYLALNIFGSAGILIEAYEKKDTPVLFLNIIWASIACIGLLKTIL